MDSLNTSASAPRNKSPTGNSTRANYSKLNSSNISKADIQSNLQAISKEVQKHAANSKKIQFNDTVNDILNNLQEEDKKMSQMVDKKGRNSILDLDLVNSNRGEEKSKKKKRPVSTGMQSSGFNNSISDDNSYYGLDTDQSNSFANGKRQLKNEKQPNFFERNKTFMQKKQYKLDVERNKKRENEKKKITDKPQLTKNTLKIIADKNEERPLYLRTQEVLERKNNKLENLKRLYTELEKPEEIKESNLARNLNLQLVTTQSDHSKVMEWVNQQAIWQKKKEEKVERLKNDMQRLDTEAEDLLYKPLINKTSEILVKMKSKGDGEGNKKAAYERLYLEHENHMLRQQKLYNDHIPKFTPLVHKDKPSYTKYRLSFLGGNDPVSTINSLRGSSKKKPKFSSSKALSSSAVDMDSAAGNLGMTNSLAGGFKNGSQDKAKVKSKNWEDYIENINNSQRKKEEKDSLYKLNIRSASAWDKDKENNIYLEKKFTYLVKDIK